MPTVINTTKQMQVMFTSEKGDIYTIEYPHLYKLNVDPKSAKPGSALITDMRPGHKLYHTSPTSVWQFVTPGGSAITVHSAFQGSVKEYGVRGREDDSKKIDSLIKSDEGMKTASETKLKEANCPDTAPTLSDKISDITAPLSKVSVGRDMTAAEAKKDVNDFNKQYFTEQIGKYGASIAERKKWKDELEQTKGIPPQPNSAVQLQSTNEENLLASELLPQLKSQLDGTILKKQEALDIAKYCAPEMMPTKKELTDGQKAKNNIIDSLGEGMGAPFLDGLKESNDPQ